MDGRDDDADKPVNDQGARRHVQECKILNEDFVPCFAYFDFDCVLDSTVCWNGGPCDALDQEVRSNVDLYYADFGFVYALDQEVYSFSFCSLRALR